MREDPFERFMAAILLGAGLSFLIGMVSVAMKWMGWLEWDMPFVLLPFAVAIVFLIPVRWIGLAICALFDIY